MVPWVQILLSIFGTFFVIGYIIFRVINTKISRKVDGLQPNAPRIENHARRQFTNGYYTGLLISQIPNKNKTTTIKFVADDIDQSKTKPKPPIQTVIVANQFIKRFAKGEISSRREIIKLLPRSQLDLPEKMRDIDEGKWLTKEGQKAFMERLMGITVPLGDESLTFMFENWGARSQMTKGVLAQLKEENAEKMKLLAKPQEFQQEIKR